MKGRMIKGILKYAGMGFLILAVLGLLYFFVMMRPGPLMEKFSTTEAPVAAEVTQYNFKLDTAVATVGDTEELAAVWQAMQDTQVRFLRSFSLAGAPQDGYFYESVLYDGAGEPLYTIGCNTDGEVIIDGKSYLIAGESDLLEAFAKLIEQSDPVITPAE